MAEVWFVFWFIKATFSIAVLWAVALFAKWLIRLFRWRLANRRLARQPIVHSLGTLPAPRNCHPSQSTVVAHDARGQGARTQRAESQ